MSTSTGIHLSDHILRLVVLERTGAEHRLCHVAEARLPVPFRPAELRRPGDREAFARGLQNALADLPLSGPIIASLGGGFFHVQKVPLEVASREDRRDQMTWEVSQTLISPETEYLIDFYPAGRAAFWVAIRRELIDLCTDLFSTAGLFLHRLEVEPFALFYACEMAGVWSADRKAVLLPGETWLSFVAAEENRLIAAETLCVAGPFSASGSPVPRNGRNTWMLQDTYEISRRWICGDPALDRRRTAYTQVFISGVPEHITPLIQRLRAASSPTLLPLKPFSSCRTESIPEAQLARQSAFGVAAGLAYRGLEKDPL